MSLTIVMYHYVRDLEASRYPRIKGRRTSEFRAQLSHIASRYSVVTAEHVIAAVQGDADLPQNAAWLTFDDGYIDHYNTVFPLLHERRWQGSFFPPARTIIDRELLDVNKVHFILASETDIAGLLSSIERFVGRQTRADVLTFEEYWERVDKTDRHDTPEVVFIKRVLQHLLPEDIRAELADELFAKHVSVDPLAFANELYMSIEQLKVMRDCGMFIGSHGDKHYWLDRISPEEQAEDLERSVSFLKLIGAPATDWIMCYPFGAYNEQTLAILKALGCQIGLTTRVSVADLDLDRPLELPRLDTNDLPFS